MRLLTRSETAAIVDSVIRIDHSDVVGSGFFVLPGVVATCRHVIEGGGTELRLTSRVGQLSVREVLLPSSSADVALVCVTELQHPVVPIGRPEKFGGSVYSYGFQYTDRRYNGYSYWGTLAGVALERIGDASAELLLVQGTRVQPGASGAPLYSLEDGRVVGLVKRENPDGGGYAVPVEKLEELYPDLLARNHALTANLARRGAELQKYIDRLAEEHRHITMVDLHRELKLEDIYISLSLAPDSVVGKSLMMNVAGALESRGFESAKEADVRRDLGSPHRHYRQREASVHEVLAHQRLIVIGEPGIGKTTFLRHLVSRACRGELFGGKLPVYLKLVHLDPRPGCLSEHIRKVYPKHAEAVTEATSAGDAVYFFDGLDEVPVEAYETIRSEVSGIAADGNKVVVTCRSAVLPPGLFSSAFRVYEVVGFSPPQQRRFLLQWFRDDGSKAVALERQLRANVGLSTFARNPLLLSLIAVVTENDRNFRLPTHRATLYRRVVDLFLRRRGDTPATAKFSKRAKLKLLEWLAFEMLLANQETCSEETLLDWIDRYQSEHVSSILAGPDAEALADVLVRHDGLLVEAEPSWFRFIHLTFQEFLAASYCTRRDQWEHEKFAEHIGDPRWEEVVRIASGLLPADRVPELLRRALATDDVDIENAETDRLFLAGRCMSDAPEVSGDLPLALTDRVVAEIFDSTNPDHVVDDATVTLALLCRSHEMLMQRTFVKAIERLEGRTTFEDLMRYVRLLDLIGLPASGSELLALLRQLRTAGVAESEVGITVVSAIVRALGRSGDLSVSQELLACLQNDSSTIEAASALALADLGAADAGALGARLESPASRFRATAGYVLMKTADARTWIQLLDRAFTTNVDVTMQLLVRQCMDSDWLDLEPDSVRGMLRDCRDDVGRTHFLGAIQLLMRLSDRTFLNEWVLDRSLALALRCSALDTLVRLVPEAANHILPQVEEGPECEHLWRCCLGALTASGSAAGHELIAATIDPAVPGALHAASLRLFTAVPSKLAEPWIQAVINTSRPPSPSWGRAAVALSAVRSPTAMGVLRSCFESPCGVRERLVGYRGLGLLGTSQASELIVETMFKESEVGAITQAIRSLSKFQGDSRVEDALLTCLRPTTWPRNWPRPLPPLRRGEQRPGDQRRLAAVIALNRAGSLRSVPFLRSAADDGGESNDIRQAAHLAVRTISWSAQSSGKR